MDGLAVETPEERFMSNVTVQDSDVEKDLAELSKAPIQHLRLRWKAVFRSEPPAAFGPDLLRRSIAQRMQEQHYGGLSATVQRRLSQIVKTIASKPNGRIELPKRIKPGSVLVRTWKDKSHRVVVLDDGFAFEGSTYASLSEVAREITGTRWNGPKFFGLRAAKPASKEIVDEAPKRRGRPPVARTDRLPSTTEVSHDR
jgi:Protein of unknown function (DUF2924)